MTFYISKEDIATCGCGSFTGPLIDETRVPCFYCTSCCRMRFLDIPIDFDPWLGYEILYKKLKKTKNGLYICKEAPIKKYASHPVSRLEQKVRHTPVQIEKIKLETIKVGGKNVPAFSFDIFDYLRDNPGKSKVVNNYKTFLRNNSLLVIYPGGEEFDDLGDCGESREGKERVPNDFYGDYRGEYFGIFLLDSFQGEKDFLVEIVEDEYL